MNDAQRLAERLHAIERRIARITDRQQRDAVTKTQLEHERLELRCCMTAESESAYRALQVLHPHAAGERRG